MPFTYIALGDIHQDLARVERMAGRLAAADGVLVTGDLAWFSGEVRAVDIARRLLAANRSLVAVTGNVDDGELAAFLDREGAHLDGRGRTIGPVGFFGVSAAPRGYTGARDTDALLERGLSAVARARWKVMLSHFPPAGTAVDLAASGDHVGSRRVRAFIEKHRPDLCLCGHIHESRGEDRLGPTAIVNPGPFFEGWYAEIEADDRALTWRLRSTGEPPPRAAP